MNSRSLIAPLVEHYLSLLGETDDAPTRGESTDVPQWHEWDEYRLLVLAWVLFAWLTLLELVGDTASITSMRRFPGSNLRRGGTPGSRHLYQDDETGHSIERNGSHVEGIQGRPFGAVDGRLDNASSIAWLRQHAQWVPHYIRAVTGWPHGVGVIIYRSGAIHLDLRATPDYVEVK